MRDFFKLRIRPWGFLTAAGFLGLLGSLAGFLGRHAWWLDIGAHFRVQYTMLFAVLAACYLAGKKRRWALAYLLLAAINFIPVAAYRFPTREYDRVKGPSMKVALMNVNTQMGKPDEVARFLQQENPDVVILEEINDDWMRRLAPSLNSYPGRIVQTRDDNFGIGVFARTGILSTQVVYFGTADLPSIVTTMDLGGQPFTLVATHPLPPGGAEYSRLRNEQLDCVAGYVKTNNGPLILLGDLNITPWSPIYGDFIRRSGLENSSRGKAIHPSWPSFSPLFLIPIDHCLHNTGIAIKSERVGRSVGSDHLPVIVEFGLKERSDLLPWHTRIYSDGHALARAIYDQASALAKDRSLESGFAPLLTNTKVIYVDLDGTEITVRDMAFTILNEAHEVGLPEGATRSKLICCCTDRGEILYRAHIPVISDEEFRETISSLKKTTPDTLLDRFGHPDGTVDHVRLWQALGMKGDSRLFEKPPKAEVLTLTPRISILSLIDIWPSNCQFLIFKCSTKGNWKFAGSVDVKDAHYEVPECEYISISNREWVTITHVTEYGTGVFMRGQDWHPLDDVSKIDLSYMSFARFYSEGDHFTAPGMLDEYEVSQIEGDISQGLAEVTVLHTITKKSVDDKNNEAVISQRKVHTRFVWSPKGIRFVLSGTLPDPAIMP